ncbi:MAG: alpha/beta fold hydrolase [Flavobacteriales bacterium]|nr:alpha/beta fold hydrolase [Flavobacteriales bacterium]
MKPQFIKFKNINVCFTDDGKGKAVVFLHGFLEDKSIWKDFAKELTSSTTRVITIDLLGHGQTECLSYVHTMEEMAEAVEFVLNHLKIRKAYFVGHSLGGYVSLAYAEKNPDNLRGLCMFHSTARADSEEKKKDRDRAIKVVKKNKNLFINEAIPNLFNTQYKPFKRGIEQIKKIANSTSLQGVVAALEGMKIRLDREIILKFAPYPVLYIIGKQDNILPYHSLIEQSQQPDNGTYLLLENVGHAGFVEDKKTTLKAVKEFLNS